MRASPFCQDVMRMGALKRLTAACAVLACLAAPGSALAIESYGPELTPLAGSELRALRGGVRVAGVDFDFGAVVRVFVDGALVADTVMSMNQNGTMSRTTTIHDTTIASEITGGLNSGNIRINGPRGSIGVVIRNGEGTSLALNNITARDTFALLANDAIGRHIMQTVDLNLTINNFGQINSMLQGDIAAARALSASLPNSLLMH